VAGVYLSYPFCAQKCTYCNFGSGVFPRELAGRYLEALRREIQNHEWAWRPETVYLGGGTPSVLEPSQVLEMLNQVPGAPWIEATIEVAPGTVSVEKAAGWVKAGINRVSLGVQSFVRSELVRTGRKHTAELVAAEIGVLRAAGIGNINIDLIAGLPGQTAASWNESLRWVDRLGPEHVSVYMLEVDDDSRLGREILAGGVRYGAADVPGEELVVEFYEMAVEHLSREGLMRYEISNFARPGRESLHNLKYWRLEPYRGFGADAHSFDGKLRWQNPEAVAAYLEAHTPMATETHPEEEKFFLGLRLAAGVRPEQEEWLRYHEPIQRFVSAGLLTTDSGGMLRLTERGILLSNEVFQAFLAA